MDKTILYFKNLDSIRFFAAFIVFVEHAVSPAYKYLPIQGTYFMKILNVFSDGGIGVSVFFVLSGFLITRPDLVTRGSSIFNSFHSSFL